METIIFSSVCVSRLRVHTDSFNISLTTHFLSWPAGATHDIHLALNRFYLQPAKREQSKGTAFKKKKKTGSLPP